MGLNQEQPFCLFPGKRGRCWIQPEQDPINYTYSVPAIDQSGVMLRAKQLDLARTSQLLHNVGKLLSAVVALTS